MIERCLGTTLFIGLHILPLCTLVHVVAIVAMFDFMISGGLYSVQRATRRWFQREVPFVQRKRIQWKTQHLVQISGTLMEYLKSWLKQSTAMVLLPFILHFLVQPIKELSLAAIHLPLKIMSLWSGEFDPGESDRSRRAHRALSRHKVVRSTAWTRLFAASMMLMTAASQPAAHAPAMLSAVPTVLSAATAGDAQDLEPHKQQFDTDSLLEQVPSCTITHYQSL